MVQASLITACYIAYVVITHGDGAVLASVCAGIGATVGVTAKAFYDHRKRQK